MPEYVFLSPNEKKGYFRDKFQAYKRALANDKISLRHTHKRKVAFEDTMNLKCNNLLYSVFRVMDSAAQVASGKVLKRSHSPLTVRSY